MGERLEAWRGGAERLGVLSKQVSRAGDDEVDGRSHLADELERDVFSIPEEDLDRERLDPDVRIWSERLGGNFDGRDEGSPHKDPLPRDDADAASALDDHA